jgi:TM2 domain-containing membrane protein YozV
MVPAGNEPGTTVRRHRREPTMTDEARWYYVGSFGQLGPLTKGQIEELIEGGVIERSTFVWEPAMTDWLPAGNIAALSPMFSQYATSVSPPPVPGTVPPITFQSSQQKVQSVQMQQFGASRTLQLQVSDKGRTAAGVLQLLLPGVGRMYLGYAAIGVLQLVVALCTGVGIVWSIVDGILILSGKLQLDGYGRVIED